MSAASDELCEALLRAVELLCKLKTACDERDEIPLAVLDRVGVQYESFASKLGELAAPLVIACRLLELEPPEGSSVTK